MNFSFDVRGRPLNDAQHWSAPETFGSRARFNADVDPATLDIKVSYTTTVLILLLFLCFSFMLHSTISCNFKV